MAEAEAKRRTSEAAGERESSVDPVQSGQFSRSSSVRPVQSGQFSQASSVRFRAGSGGAGCVAWGPTWSLGRAKRPDRGGASPSIFIPLGSIPQLFKGQLPKGQASPEQTALHGSDRHPQNICNLLIVQILHVAEDEQCPHPRVEPEEGPGERLPQLDLFDAIGALKFPRHGSGDRPETSRTGWPPPRRGIEAAVPPQSLLPQVAEAAVHGHSNDPGAELRTTVVGVEPLQNPDQRLLSEIGGLVGAAEHPVADGVDPCLIAAKERGNRLAIAVPPGMEQGGVVAAADMRRRDGGVTRASTRRARGLASIRLAA